LLPSGFTYMIVAMKNRLIGCVLVGGIAISGGCYGRMHGGIGFRAHNPVAQVIGAAVTVAAVAAIVATAPPVVARVEYYDYGARPGQCWVNGRYTYVGNQWQWQNGYWQDDRAGYYWVQGYWAPQGNGYAWVDGYWAEPRAGYTYVDGYWNYTSGGYVWVPGTWEAERQGQIYVGGYWNDNGGTRTWVRGGWHHDDGRGEWSHWRTRGRSTTTVHTSNHGNSTTTVHGHSTTTTTTTNSGGGTVIIRDHR
jgi:hypothetical protein